ncbi:hypothetical protein CRI94_10735 [Longibacter salinarum]|uniref:methanethiol S-methyltransferase n=1 Tax=Longibacter salinarum TaxID=1850348 RepID=A0A2A8CXH1_9BACT|nr:methanethiol S-methyltransferase [Longibacter salinarum]PEN13320.1 hypothetical protein CRI94_10735 [Longibacter salinarum]
MKRALFFAYGIVSYLIFLLVFSYAVAFIGDFAVPKTINSGPESAFWTAILINTGLLGLFAVQHSGMARSQFKEWWTRIVPPSVERTTYVLVASGVLALLMWQWRPLTGIVWEVEAGWAETALWAGFGLGWLIVLGTTFIISHWHLFGLKQVHSHYRKQEAPKPQFQVRSLYKYVRHPLYLGFLIAFWSTPTMTVGHLLFAAASTGYILVGATLEERDLIARFGERYRRYRERVPMLLPGLSGGKSTAAKETSARPHHS